MKVYTVFLDTFDILIISLFSRKKNQTPWMDSVFSGLFPLTLCGDSIGQEYSYATLSFLVAATLD